jgi:hypothetical protein
MVTEKKKIILYDLVVPPTYYNNTEHVLHVRPSQIKQAGNGIFFHDRILKKGELVGYYEGKLVKTDPDVCVGDYSFELDDDWYIDARAFPRPYTAMINDAYGSKFTNNCEFVLVKYDDDNNELMGKDIKIALQTTRDIHMGEELFASYGDPYWSCDARKGKKKKKNNKKSKSKNK